MSRTKKMEETPQKVYIEQIYRIYEFDDGLYFPDMKFRCGRLENYVKTGILSMAEVEEIWKENATLK
ncbi:MAG: hypothetical protein J6I76_18175 [Oribacterium sp.]|nr:hypothetical protein [Oribacterium sp.]